MTNFSNLQTGISLSFFILHSLKITEFEHSPLIKIQRKGQFRSIGRSIISYLFSSLVVLQLCKNSHYYTVQEKKFYYCWLPSVKECLFLHCRCRIFILLHSDRVRMETITRSERKRRILYHICSVP